MVEAWGGRWKGVIKMNGGWYGAKVGWVLVGVWMKLKKTFKDEKYERLCCSKGVQLVSRTISGSPRNCRQTSKRAGSDGGGNE